MRKFIVVLTLATAAAIAQENVAPTAAAAKQSTPAKSKKLSRAEFEALLANPGQVLIIDVRRPDEHTSIGGFPAYLSIQLADLEKYQAFIPKDRTLITVSNHAARGLKAADLLDSKGFKVAGAIGAQDYEAEGGTLSKFAAPTRSRAAEGQADTAQANAAKEPASAK